MNGGENAVVTDVKLRCLLKKFKTTYGSECALTSLACFLFYNADGCCIMKYEVKSSNLI